MDDPISQINNLTWIILIGEIVIGLGLIFLASYLKKKAENIADRSDLERLTDIVESVKQEYSKETEILKANLQVLTYKKTDILNEEKEALLDFYHELNVWIYSKLNVKLADYNHVRLDELKDRIIDNHNTYNRVNILFAKFKVITNNSELVKKGGELISVTLEYHQYIEKKMRSMKFNLALEKGTADTLSKYLEEEKEIPKDGKEFISKMSEYTGDKREEIFDEYYDEKLDLFKKVLDLRQEFELLVNKQLHE